MHTTSGCTNYFLFSAYDIALFALAIWISRLQFSHWRHHIQMVRLGFTIFRTHWTWSTSYFQIQSGQKIRIGLAALWTRSVCPLTLWLRVAFQNRRQHNIVCGRLGRPSLDAARHSVVIVFLVFIANSNDRTRTKRYWQKAQETLATIANRMQQITSDALTHSLQPTQYAATVCAVRRRENIIRLKIISLFANWFHLANRVTEGSIGDNSIDWTDARDLLHKFHYRFRSTVADRTDEVPIRIAMAM